MLLAERWDDAHRVLDSLLHTQPHVDAVVRTDAGIGPRRR
jgi:hypothetical protein